MKYYIIILSTLILGSCRTVKPIPQQQEEKKVELVSNALGENAIITALASDKFGGRKPGTEGFELASNYVENFLKSEGIKPYFADNYKDPVSVRGVASNNIVGLIGDKTNGKDFIILSAHLDHLGKTSSKTDSVYNGANDDASGVTAVLEIAKSLSKLNLNKNVIVALFTGEESGLIGSRSLAKKLKAENINLKYMLNFEMIGKTMTNAPGQVYLTGYKKSNMAEEMNKAAGSEFVIFSQVEIENNLFRRSDNYAFYEQFGIPAQTFSSFDFLNYAYYHELKDEVDQLDLANMNDIIKKSAAAIQKLIESDAKIIMR
jgi:Zn-dependent M28 family amino/carboxypeptidase